MCIRPARPFLQILRRREFQLHRFDSVVVTPSTKDDLKLWWLILYSPRLNGVVLQYFCVLPQLDIAVETDASDYGLCTPYVTSKVALTYQFTSTQQNLVTDFKASGVNAWSHVCMSLTPGEDDGRLSHRLHPDHCMSTSVMTTSLPSLGRPSWNPEILGLKRFSACWTTYHLRFSSSHVPGAINTRADAGSRIGSHHSFANAFRPFGHPGVYNPLVAYLRAHSVADSTFTKIASALSKWQAWTSHRGISPWCPGLSITDRGYNLDSVPISRSSPLLSWPLSTVSSIFASAGTKFPIRHPHMYHNAAQGLLAPRFATSTIVASLNPSAECMLYSLTMSDPAAQVLWGVRDRGHRSILLRWFALLAEDIIVTDSQSFTTRDPRQAQAVRTTLCGSKANEGGPTYSENVGTLWSPVSLPVLGALLLLWVCGKLPHNIPAATGPRSRVIIRCRVRIKRATIEVGAGGDFITHSLRA
ncbi:Hypothetical protein PHPALM_15694 [Phytophthora palmivora]|uniref:Uncharacterized protein n=1 Tax=Phytophthora palmivora TaxID=4796 RepID=A0A2P4XRN4_9STRA|nr:Hypothetical protein PHPALM_15694 [Phytophthora palmivora]